MVINEGESFNSHIQSNGPIEGLVVAYSKADFNSTFHNMSRTYGEMLDDPFEYKSSQFIFESKCLILSKPVRHLMKTLRTNIVSAELSTFSYEQLFQQLFMQVVSDTCAVSDRLGRTSIKKSTTKKELFRRLLIAKEYMDNNLQEELTLKKLSQLSALSEFHFLRCFALFMGHTPHKYLVKKRMTRAMFLLRDQEEPVSVISQIVGFKDRSSFGRLFKKITGMTPLSYRKAYSKTYFSYT